MSWKRLILFVFFFFYGCIIGGVILIENLPFWTFYVAPVLMFPVLWWVLHSRLLD